MSVTLFSCLGGQIVLPNRTLVLVDREDGGNLVVNPPREVWQRAELTRTELTHWSFLVAATGAAMIDTLSQLNGGCVNYWEAGNWALNDAAEPIGPKIARESRKVHMHLLGRSRTARNASWKWGEAPKFPEYADRLTWAAPFQRLTPEECSNIVANVEELLTNKYAMDRSHIAAWSPCANCHYPTVLGRNTGLCDECYAAR
jgi:hypothetical protein